MRTQFVLVPGFWLGAWAWDEVAPLLRERGVAVDALTLPGGDGEIRLEDWAKAIREALDGRLQISLPVQAPEPTRSARAAEPMLESLLIR